MPKKGLAKRLGCAVSFFPFTMQVDTEHKHIPSRKGKELPQKDLQPTDLDERLTALRRRTAG
jgi:hypothetical protein